MSQNNPQYLKWPIKEHNVPERKRSWYIIASAFLLICLFFSFFSISGWKISALGYNSNFFFALILILAAIIMIINNSQKPLVIDFELGPEGVRVGSKFYDYDEIKNFSVIYKPKQSIKNLYIEFKNSIRPRLSVPLRRMDALSVRNFLVRYLDEDLERTDAPLSEHLTKLLKL